LSIAIDDAHGWNFVTRFRGTCAFQDNVRANNRAIIDTAQSGANSIALHDDF